MTDEALRHLRRSDQGDPETTLRLRHALVRAGQPDPAAQLAQALHLAANLGLCPHPGCGRALRRSHSDPTGNRAQITFIRCPGFGGYLLTVAHPTTTPWLILRSFIHGALSLFGHRATLDQDGLPDFPHLGYHFAYATPLAAFHAGRHLAAAYIERPRLLPSAAPDVGVPLGD